MGRMLCVVAVVCALMLGSFAVAFVQAADRIPDPAWRPKIGDRVELYDEDGDGDVPVARGFLDYLELMKLARAKDDVGAQKLIDSGRVLSVKSGTRVTILDIHTEPTYGRFVEVRVTNGALKGEKVYVGPGFLASMIDNPEAPRPAPRAPVRKADPVATRKSRLAAAKALEKSNAKASIAAYERIAKDYPDTDEAKAAKKRLAELRRKK
jgi:hypothetical protein